MPEMMEQVMAQGQYENFHAADLVVIDRKIVKNRGGATGIEAPSWLLDGIYKWVGEVKNDW